MTSLLTKRGMYRISPIRSRSVPDDRSPERRSPCSSPVSPSTSTRTPAKITTSHSSHFHDSPHSTHDAHAASASDLPRPRVTWPKLNSTQISKRHQSAHSTHASHTASASDLPRPRVTWPKLNSTQISKRHQSAHSTHASHTASASDLAKIVFGQDYVWRWSRLRSPATRGVAWLDAGGEVGRRRSDEVAQVPETDRFPRRERLTVFNADHAPPVGALVAESVEDCR